MRGIKRIFVHCTAGSQKTTLKQLEQEFKNKGWKNPGYHYVVFPDGKIEQMLDESLVSNGVQGYNSTSINVAYVGGVDSKLKPIDNRTDAQKESLKSLLTDLKTSYPDAHIMGHRDIWGKDEKDWLKWCPCFDAEAEYASLGNPELAPEESKIDEDVALEDLADHVFDENVNKDYADITVRLGQVRIPCEEEVEIKEEPKQKKSWFRRLLEFLRILKKN